MANIAALKKKAAEFEAKKQVDKAIAAYREVLDAYDSGEEAKPEIALYNRVGDMLARQGNTPEAVTLYERAVDLYTEGGFFNNAIALCNKVLRTSPGRASVYYKLGKISAAKGFKGEAKQNFLEYADRMQKSGQMDEAFRALKEFADLVPDEDDVRLMLADQLTRANRSAEALEQLRVLYEKYQDAGQSAEADATAERMRAIDPSVELGARAAGKQASAKAADDLVFIDLSSPAPRRTTRTTPISEPPSRPSAARAKPPEPVPAPPSEEPTPLAAPAASLGGLEITSTTLDGAVDSAPGDAGAMLGLEPTSFSDTVAAPEPEPMAASEFATIDLSAIEEAPTGRRSARSDLALGGDLPVIDVSGSEGPELLDLDTSSSAPVELEMVDLGAAAAELGVEATALDETPGGGDLPLLDVGGGDMAAVAAPGEPVVDTPTAFGEVADEVVEAPAPVRRASSMLAANAVLTLRIRVEDEPENWALRRQLGEALLEEGERDEGMRELEAALIGFDKANDLDSATSVIDEIVRIVPGSVRFHQKRVEYAFRANDKARTAEAYVALADALFRDGQADRARQVYQRVLEIAPGDVRAVAALEAIGGPPAPPPAAPPQAKGKRYTGAVEGVQHTPVSTPAVKGGDDDFVSLGDWLREDEAPKNTRMVVEEQEPTGDEQADFADMLKKFKQGISENVEDEDHEAHYDLGVAFKEMGLVDEAIAEFQKALRGTQNRVRTYEALGQCFLEKKQLPVAVTILQRALNEPGVGDEQLVGVLYLLGYINESLGKPVEAKPFYERVFAVDIQFRDVGDRLNAVDKAQK
ncbi:MAG: tetratricopeptide repeat protein [Gemmatimonadetes bacterium]|nr:tetratricopeptide repeat protein [Gemmatimonadota bacterium]